MAFDNFIARDTKDDNKGVFASFFTDAVELTFRSEQEGRPIYEDREFIKIITSGSTTEVVHQVNEGHKQRFPEEYRRFKAGEGEKEQMVGTPLSAWPAMTPAMIRTLNAQNVFTVEQLADVSDVNMQHAGFGGSAWREKARAYLAHAADASGAVKLAAALAERDKEIAFLKRQFEDLARRMPPEDADEGEDAPRRRPGRPRTAVAA